MSVAVWMIIYNNIRTNIFYFSLNDKTLFLKKFVVARPLFRKIGMQVADFHVLSMSTSVFCATPLVAPYTSRVSADCFNCRSSFIISCEVLQINIFQIY